MNTEMTEKKKAELRIEFARQSAYYREQEFKERTREELEFVESVFPDCMALTFASEDGWLKKRREFICASDTPSLLGVGFRSNISVWEDKCDPEAVKRRKPVGSQVERSMKLGKLSEQFVRDQLSIDWQKAVFDGTNILMINTRILDENGDPFLAATLDGFMLSDDGRPIIVEIKRTESWKAFGATPPIGYRAQVLKQMLVTGASNAILVARTVMYENNRRSAKETEYYFDKSNGQDYYDMQCIEKLEREFWNNNILKKKKPDLKIAEPM